MQSLSKAPPISAIQHMGLSTENSITRLLLVCLLLLFHGMLMPTASHYWPPALSASTEVKNSKETFVYIKMDTFFFSGEGKYAYHVCISLKIPQQTVKEAHKYFLNHWFPAWDILWGEEGKYCRTLSISFKFYYHISFSPDLWRKRKRNISWIFHLTNFQ